MNEIGKKRILPTNLLTIVLFVLVVMLLAVTFAMPIKAYAEQIDNYKQVEAYAESFVSKEPGVRVDSIVPIYDLNNRIVRYSVNYVDANGNDYGYIILNKQVGDKRGAVIEMSLGNKSNMTSKNDKYYYLDGLDYGTKINGSEIKTGDRVISLSTAKKKYKTFLNDNSEADDGYVDVLYVGEITRELKIADYFYTFTPLTQSDLRSAGLKYGDYLGICGLTTAMNVLKYYYDSGLSKYSNIMVKNNDGSINLATTAYRLYSGYVPSGSTYNLPNNIVRKNALNHYIGTYTSLNKTISRYIGIQFWNYFYNDISNGYIIDVRYDVTSDEGHAVLCIGAVEVSGPHYAGSKYLLVADTGDADLKLLNFNYYNRLQGMKIKVY